MPKKKNNRSAGRRIWALVLALCLCAAFFAAVQLVHTQRGYTAARQEYDALRALLPMQTPEVEPPTDEKAAPPTEASAAQEGLCALAALNPDFIGWLRIEGTGIDYPLVRGTDNQKYLNTTFEGKNNPMGAVFMDARCTGGFEETHSILYGHNAKDGSMFGGLKAYLDAEFLAQHAALNILLPSGEELRYRIFAARATDVNDEVYRLDAEVLQALAAMPGAPQGAERFLTLSTCAGGQGGDERLLVFATME